MRVFIVAVLIVVCTLCFGVSSLRAVEYITPSMPSLDRLSTAGQIVGVNGKDKVYLTVTRQDFDLSAPAPPHHYYYLRISYAHGQEQNASNTVSACLWCKENIVSETAKELQLEISGEAGGSKTKWYLYFDGQGRLTKVWARNYSVFVGIPGTKVVGFFGNERKSRQFQRLHK